MLEHPASARPPLKTCPICKLAMVASKTSPGAAAYDTFTCLDCKTVISLSPMEPGAQDRDS
jgi:hypothetical protein